MRMLLDLTVVSYLGCSSMWSKVFLIFSLLIATVNYKSQILFKRKLLPGMGGSMLSGLAVNVCLFVSRSITQKLPNSFIRNFVELFLVV